MRLEGGRVALAHELGEAAVVEPGERCHRPQDAAAPPDIPYGSRCCRKNSQNSGATAKPAGLFLPFGYWCVTPASRPKRNRGSVARPAQLGRPRAREHAELIAVQPERVEVRVQRRGHDRLAQQRERVQRQLGERRRPGLGEDAVVERAQR